MNTLPKNDITFIRLLDGSIDTIIVDNIEIPIIQRDYVHGRPGAEEKLNKLLGDIESALKTGVPLGLNFVYGKITTGRFIPMDGQQRLTLLFLLHTYAFASQDTMTPLLSKFTYRTRETSRMFIKEIVKNRREIFESGLAPSKEITNNAWFLPQWNHDPTIQSMLVVFDKIAQQFPDKKVLAEGLSKGLVTFKFLNMKDIGLEDNLYIKLNDRGKPLSGFENFKAKLIRQAEKLGTDLAKKFTRQLDCDWTDIFWNKTKNQTFDVLFLTFIIETICNNQLIAENRDSVNGEKLVDNIDKKTIAALYYTLQALRIKELWNCFPSDFPQNVTFESRTILHAMTVYAIHTKDEIPDDAEEWERLFPEWYKRFQKWHRIIRNLVQNTDVRQRNFLVVLQSINIFADHCQRIETFFADSEEFGQIENNLFGFLPSQIKEERLKAQLIEQGESFRTVIEEAEKFPYFSGQLTGIMSFAGFLLDDKDNLECKLRAFNDYWSLCTIIFKGHAHEEYLGVDGILFRRALLTFGDYRKDVSWSGYKTFVVDSPAEENSWKTVFASENISRDLLKKLFDVLLDKKADTKDKIEENFIEMIKSSQIEPTCWRYHLVSNGEIWEFWRNSIRTTQWRMYDLLPQIFLVSKSDLRSRYFELNAFLVYLHFFKKGKHVPLQYGYGITRQECTVERLGIHQELIVRCVYGKGLTILYNDGQPLNPPVAEKTADEVIQYLEEQGY